jgi:hypothetical protein
VKPRFDLQHGIWRCRLKGTRVAGFGRSPQEAWDEFRRDAWIKAALPRELMGA